MWDLDNLSKTELTYLQGQITNRLRDLEAQERVKRRSRAEQAAEALARREAEGLEMYATLKVGDIVRVDGVRDRRYPLRRVTSIGNGRFTGWQMGYRNPRNKTGGLVQGSQHTDHMANKIREIIQKED